eukprot:355280-Chlamydomonas_euryale.AAC.4
MLPADGLQLGLTAPPHTNLGHTDVRMPNVHTRCAAWTRRISPVAGRGVQEWQCNSPKAVAHVNPRRTIHGKQIHGHLYRQLSKYYNVCPVSPLRFLNLLPDMASNQHARQVMEIPQACRQHGQSPYCTSADRRESIDNYVGGDMQNSALKAWEWSLA